jgi:serine/threonine protein kinase
MAGDAPRPGDRVGPYALESLLGEGGFASVWIARDPGRRAVVVKLLHAEVAMEPAVLERFEREIAVLRSLEHPGIVRLIDHDAGHARPYFVMERVVGQVLRDRLLESATMSRALTVAQVVSIVRHLADALAFAHAAGVIHRDLKPANVLLDVQDRPRLLDFGLARITGTDAHAATTLGRIMGSRYYWAPEQALGEGSSAATDQFCLATLAFELLTLRRAWVRGDADTEAPYMHVSAPLDVNRPLDILERLVSGRRCRPRRSGPTCRAPPTGCWSGRGRWRPAIGTPTSAPSPRPSWRRWAICTRRPTRPPRCASTSRRGCWSRRG